MQNNQHDIDLIIVGAGIHGAAIALEASLQGYRVQLIEQYDRPARGTSSKSSKLIHGGLRYLESFQFGLVQECLADRRRLLQKYPDLVKLQKFHIPVYRDSSRSRLIILIGLCLYTLLGGMRRENRFRSLSTREWPDLDELRTDNLLAVFQYFDAQTDDALLTERLIEEASAAGAKVLFNAEFTGCTIDKDRVTIEYRHDNENIRKTARFLINASGPWVNQVAGRCTPAFRQLDIDLVKGTHIEIPGRVNRGIYYLEAPQDRRAVFVMPWRDHILVGTTETLYNGDPAECAPSRSDIEYLLSVYNHYFTHTLDHDDVITIWSGLRVLPKSEKNPFKRTRETIFLPNDKNNPRIYSIYGGKLTSHHSTAIKLLKLLKGQS